MISIMYRSFADNQGFNWPPEIAYTVNGKPVTYAEVKAQKVAEQKKRLEFILDNEYGVIKRKAAQVWVFKVAGPFYSGWHLYLRTLKDRWGIKKTDEIALKIMTLFPCGFLPLRENFEQWKIAFAKTYARPTKIWPKQGLVNVWVDLAIPLTVAGKSKMRLNLYAVNAINGVSSIPIVIPYRKKW